MALDETRSNKNKISLCKTSKDVEWDKIKVTDETPLPYLIMHFGYSFCVIFGSDEEC